MPVLFQNAYYSALFPYLTCAQVFMNAANKSSTVFCVAWVKYSQSNQVTSLQVGACTLVQSDAPWHDFFVLNTRCFASQSAGTCRVI